MARRGANITMHKYLHDAEILIEFIDNREITPELLDGYKKFLLQKYSMHSAKPLFKDFYKTFGQRNIPLGACAFRVGYHDRVRRVENRGFDHK